MRDRCSDDVCRSVHYHTYASLIGWKYIVLLFPSGEEVSAYAIFSVVFANLRVFSILMAGSLMSTYGQMIQKRSGNCGK